MNKSRSFLFFLQINKKKKKLSNLKKGMYKHNNTYIEQKKYKKKTYQMRSFDCLKATIVSCNFSYAL